MDARRDERGQALPLTLLMVWLCVGVALLAVALAGRAANRARGQAGADAVALAAAAGASTDDVAVANDVTVREIDRGDNGTDVLVEHGHASARARAIAPALSRHDELDPLLRAAIARAETLLGEAIPIVSGLRTRAQQQALWDARHTNPYPVARPGTSRHELGMAIDVPVSFAPRLAAIQTQSGLCQVLPVSDPIHFEPCLTTPTP